MTYPDAYRSFLDGVNVFNFDPGKIIRVGCFMQVNFYQRLVVITSIPLVLLGLLALIFGSTLCRYSSGNVRVEIRRRHISVILLLTFLIYSPVSSTIFQTFGCDNLDTGESYLRADHSLVCYNMRHRAYMAFAGVMVLVYPVGIPLFYALLLYRGRHMITDPSRDTNADLQTFKGLWAPYRRQRYYYEVVDCARRALLSGVVVFVFPRDSAAQVSTVLLLAVFFYVVFEVLSPYIHEKEKWLSRVGHLVVILSIYMALLLKVDVSGEKHHSQELFAVLLVVVHAMMISTIAVETLVLCIGEVGLERLLSERPNRPR